jgi:hypothetical protein
LLDAFPCWGHLAISPRVLPEPERDWKRINVEFLPPYGLITRAMKLPMMDSANWDGEFVADSVSKCPGLCKREVVRIRRHSAAHKARLASHELPVILIAQANCFSQSTSCRAAYPLLRNQLILSDKC